MLRFVLAVELPNIWKEGGALEANLGGGVAFYGSSETSNALLLSQSLVVICSLLTKLIGNLSEKSNKNTLLRLPG